MISANQIRKGMVIIHKGEPHRVLDFHHRTPGNSRGFVQARLRNLKTTASYEHRFSSTDTVERAVLEQHQMEFLYRDGTHHYFMNTENFEQFSLDAQILGSHKSYLKEGAKIQVDFFAGQPISLEMPPYIELEVVETEAELRGATASNSSKPATLETGVVLQVPSFIRPGDVIRVDPHQGRYLERAK